MIWDLTQLMIYLVTLILLSYPLAHYLYRVFDFDGSRQFTFISFLERPLYRFLRINRDSQQNWREYSRDLLIFSFCGWLFTVFILKFQNIFPFNPQKYPGLTWDLAFNTATSFLTNTNWQSYSGETTLSYFSQMVGLTIQNFTSAGVGMAVAVAIMRALRANQNSRSLGNFWVDLMRGHLYVLVPFCLPFAIFLISQGVIQNFSAYAVATTLEGATQTIAQGPVASQVAIKMLGTNGGGFFNANAAHPYENPSALSNWVQMLSIFLIPSALVFLFGLMLKNKKHALSIWAAMALIFFMGVLSTYYFEKQGNFIHQQMGISNEGNWEGKEARFGIFNSSLFAVITTAASCGAVNSMHDSFTPMGSIVPIINMLLGEVIFGGVGAGFYGMIILIILTLFLCGLMIGRTPEYLGKKIESTEIKWAAGSIMILAASILVFTALAIATSWGLQGLLNAGPHGLSTILYAFTSATANNGSAFAGLSANTPFYNYTLAIAMLLGRFGVIIPVLGIAGKMAAKKPAPASEATFPIHGITFTTLLICVIFLVAALTFIPVLSLGPIAEHFEMLQQHLF